MIFGFSKIVYVGIKYYTIKSVNFAQRMQKLLVNIIEF